LYKIYNHNFMNKIRTGRPVDISGINIEELDLWIKSNKEYHKVLICQSIIALHKSAAMSDVCSVYGVTRETVRLWKEQLRKTGLSGFLVQKKVGKRSRLNLHRTQELKSLVRKSPKKLGYPENKWTGKLVMEWVQKNWNEKISLRTAQIWLTKVK
jgi:transposase